MNNKFEYQFTVKLSRLPPARAGVSAVGNPPARWLNLIHVLCGFTSRKMCNYPSYQGVCLFPP